MTPDVQALGLEGLPLQQELVVSAIDAFYPDEDVLAAVLVGSLAKGGGDRVSDADIIVLTTRDRHRRAGDLFQKFEADKAIFYTLAGEHNGTVSFRKYLFEDLTSAEIHCLDLSEPFLFCQPYRILFDKADVIAQRLTDEPAPKHEDFPAYACGDDGLIWELFDCIKWLSRGNTKLAKGYLKKLVCELDQDR